MEEPPLLAEVLEEEGSVTANSLMEDLDDDGQRPDASPAVVIVLPLSSRLSQSQCKSLVQMLCEACTLSQLNVELHHSPATNTNFFIISTTSEKSSFCTKYEGNREVFVQEDSAQQLLSLRDQLYRAVLDNPRELMLEQEEGHCSLLYISAGTPIVPFLQSRSGLRLVKNPFPLHQPLQLEQLRLHWVFASPGQLLRPPLAHIRAYFGPEIALYFAWLAHFTGWLCAPAIIGFLLFLLPSVPTLTFILFALFNSLWAIMFIRSWERHQHQLLTVQWSSQPAKIGHREEEKSKKSLETTKESSPLPPSATAVERVNRPSNMLLQGSSLPSFFTSLLQSPYQWLDLLCLLALTLALMSLVRLQDWSLANYGSGWVSRLPLVLQGLLSIGADSLYRHFARFLCEKERHQSKQKEDDALIVRLALFQSVSAFCPLFYIAFVLADWERLTESLAALLITRQFVQNFTEIGIPLAMGQIRLFSGGITTTSITTTSTAVVAGGGGSSGERRASWWAMMELWDPEKPGDGAELESALSDYERPLDDYLEMFIQLGYVLLFSPAFPLAALCALANNLLEARVDAFKLCLVHQRPWPLFVAQTGTGVWQRAIKVMCIAGVIVNWALIVLRLLFVQVEKVK